VGIFDGDLRVISLVAFPQPAQWMLARIANSLIRWVPMLTITNSLIATVGWDCIGLHPVLGREK
jgi:hypothetical protein